MADVCAKHGAAYIHHYGDIMPVSHRRVLQLLADCGTGRLGTVRYRCAECQRVHQTNASCGNRHCPACQTAAGGQWCVDQTKKLLPCEYFLVTFTIPDTLRRFVRSHQSLCYDAMMKSAAYALKTALADGKFCGAACVGFTSVLHTFGRDLAYHPHVHVIVPGGGISDSGEWTPTLPGFLAPVRVLSKLFRSRFEQLVGNQAGVCGIEAAVFREPFVCDVQSVGDGVATLKYLSRYIFRTAITNERIVSAGEAHVAFRYRRTGENGDRLMRLSPLEFLRRFLQHVLPRGFQRVRHYGYLSRRSQIDLDDLRTRILETLVDVEPDLELERWTVPALRMTSDDGPACPHCGGRSTFESFTRIRPPPTLLAGLPCSRPLDGETRATASSF
jgi:hypothetical protein